MLPTQATLLLAVLAANPLPFIISKAYLLSMRVALPSALVALVLFVVPKWRRLAFPRGFAAPLVVLLVVHALQVVFALGLAVVSLADREYFNWIGSAFLVGALAVVSINIPAFLFWRSALRRLQPASVSSHES